jgi:hypothetical protein
MTENARERADRNRPEDPLVSPNQNPDTDVPADDRPDEVPRRGFESGTEPVEPSGDTRLSLETDANPDTIETD